MCSQTFFGTGSPQMMIRRLINCENLAFNYLNLFPTSSYILYLVFYFFFFPFSFLFFTFLPFCTSNFLYVLLASPACLNSSWSFFLSPEILSVLSCPSSWPFSSVVNQSHGHIFTLCKQIACNIHGD